MKCIILAAGYATRLYPLTIDTPKPLLQVGKKKVIEYILGKVEKSPEIDEVFIVTNMKFFSNFEIWKESYKSRKPLKILNDGTTSNENRLGAIGDINFAIKIENINDDLLVIAGDNLFEFNVEDLIGFFEGKKSSVIAVSRLSDMEEVKKMGVVEMDETDRIIGFEEKPLHPRTSLASTGCYIFSKKDIGDIKSKSHDRPGDFISEISRIKPVYAHEIKGTWLDIGSFKQLEEARRMFA